MNRLVAFGLILLTVAATLSVTWYSARYFDPDLRTSLPNCGTEGESGLGIGTYFITCQSDKTVYVCDWDLGYYTCQMFSPDWSYTP